jgi:hypothetical protein
VRRAVHEKNNFEPSKSRIARRSLGHWFPWEDIEMHRWAVVFTTVVLTAAVIGLLEPVLAMLDTERLLFIIFLLPLFRSPVWLTSILGGGRVGST